MSETIKGIVQNRRKTSAQWNADDTVLLNGEIGVETDTNKIKIGDGNTEWTLLPYFGGDVGKGYKEYVGLLNFETSPEAITATVIKSDFDEIVVEHPAINVFTYTLSGAFTENKTIAFSGNITNYYVKAYRFSASAIALYFVKHDGSVNSIEPFTIPVMIRVYD